MQKQIKTDAQISKEYDEKFQIKNKQSFLSGGRITISTTISGHLWNLAKQNHIGWSEGLRTGISILLAEKGIAQYDNKLNLWRKMNFFRQEAEESCKKVEELTMKLAEREGIKMEEQKKSP